MAFACCVAFPLQSAATPEYRLPDRQIAPDYATGHAVTRLILILPFAFLLVPLPFLERSSWTLLGIPVVLPWLFAAIPLTSFCLWLAYRVGS